MTVTDCETWRQTLKSGMKKSGTKEVGEVSPYDPPPYEPLDEPEIGARGEDDRFKVLEEELRKAKGDAKSLKPIEWS